MQATLRLVCAYTELDREGFPVTDANKKEFVSRVLELADDENTVLMWDSNIRVGRLQETTAEIQRAGEAFDSGPVAKHLIDCLSRNDSGNAIVHGRLCSWSYTFEPVGQERRSVIDMCACVGDGEAERRRRLAAVQKHGAAWRSPRARDGHERGDRRDGREHVRHMRDCD